MAKRDHLLNGFLFAIPQEVPSTGINPPHQSGKESKPLTSWKNHEH